ncbi:hypothetical protein D3C81_1584030 [compost metagenome]
MALATPYSKAAELIALLFANTPAAESFRNTAAGSVPLTGSMVAFFQVDRSAQVLARGLPNTPPPPVPLVPLLLQSVPVSPLLVTFRSQPVPVQPATSALVLKS